MSTSQAKKIKIKILACEYKFFMLIDELHAFSDKVRNGMNNF